MTPRLQTSTPEVSVAIVNFDLTITAAETFTVGDIKHRLGRPGQKMTWTAYGRPNTSTTQPGQFVFAGMGFTIVPAPLGLSIHRPAGSGAIQLAREDVAGAHSRAEASPASRDPMLLKTAPINVWIYLTTMIDGGSAPPTGCGSWGCSGAWPSASLWNGNPASVSPSTIPPPISRW